MLLHLKKALVWKIQTWGMNPKVKRLNYVWSGSKLICLFIAKSGRLPKGVSTFFSPTTLASTKRSTCSKTSQGRLCRSKEVYSANKTKGSENWSYTYIYVLVCWSVLESFWPECHLHYRWTYFQKIVIMFVAFKKAFVLLLYSYEPPLLGDSINHTFQIILNFDKFPPIYSITWICFQRFLGG